MNRFDVITIFPEVISPYAEASILGRAQKKKLIKVTAHDLRSFSNDKHKKVDDTPYGGGAGMVMSVQPFDAAIKKVRRRRLIGKQPSVRVIMTSASGKRFSQEDAKRLAKYDQVIFLCGRYEGIDGRVEEYIADESLSIGDYVLTGGELPALVMIDAIARQVPEVLGNSETLHEESHDVDGQLEYPQYTKPETYSFSTIRGKKEAIEASVPAVLLSGNHAAIAKWRKEKMRQENVKKQEG
ncbi:tRNA (guanosine(37)-N1)-methyltransferase TrmD [Patescibacteria group bacterium]|nr:tRNA (guanosine(37)-N1)-methyltransferase TrmD [Patescibacteria group bacterium]